MNESGPDFDLTEAADRFRISEGDVEGVVALARCRTRRKRRAVSVMTAVALVASIPVAQRIMAPSDDGTPLAATAPVQRGSLGITWRRVESKANVAYARGVSNGKPLYAVSSAPGERAVQNRQLSRVVWRSDDGVDWTVASTLGPDLYLADLSARDNRVYAVGTSPAEAAVPNRPSTLRSSELVVSWSDDDGRHWQKERLPLDLATNVPTRFGTVATAAVASGSKGTVAIAVLAAELDVPALLPAGAVAPHGWSTTATGVDILGPEKGNPCPAGFEGQEKGPAGPQPPSEAMPTWCRKGEETVTLAPQQVRRVEAAYTWEQLGVSGDLLRAVRRQPIAFFARPGSTEFQRVEIPVVDNVMGVTLEATEDGFDMVSSVSDRSNGALGELVLLQSRDGRSWTRAAVPTHVRYAVGLGTLAGRTAIVTGDEKATSFTMADGNGGWRSVSLADVADPDVLDGRVATASWAAFGSFGVAISTALIPASRKDFNEDQVSHRILVSRDGTTWDDIALDDVLGVKGAFVTRITITGDDIVVTGALPVKGKSRGPQQQIVVVGTAA